MYYKLQVFAGFLLEDEDGIRKHMFLVKFCKKGQENGVAVFKLSSMLCNTQKCFQCIHKIRVNSSWIAEKSQLLET